MLLDELITEFDRGLRSMTGVSRMTRPLPLPAETVERVEMSTQERAHAAGLMRVNHVGEVCAQALYQAQKLATRSPALKEAFEHAAREEEDHLAWTAKRLEALDSRPSLLNPLWYAGALAIGFAAGRFGDRVSLGFMAETERQVEHHLNGHMDALPAGGPRVARDRRADARRRSCAWQSRDRCGRVELPFPARALMRAASKIMTHTAYRV